MKRTPAVSKKLSDTATQVNRKVSDLGSTAAHTIIENRDAAARGLEKAASPLHEKAESLPGGERVISVLRSTADYVRKHDVKQMIGDVDTLVKNNPGPSLLFAAVFGFMIAQTFSNND